MPRTPSLSPTIPRRGSTSAPPTQQFVFVAAPTNAVAGPSTSRDSQDGVANVVDSLNKRQPPSCDACRTRKLKCSGRPTVIELGPEATATTPCDHCREWNLDCSYLYQRKRRGRKNRVVERLAEEQRARRKSQSGTTGDAGRSRLDTNGGSASDSEDGLPARRGSYEAVALPSSGIGYSMGSNGQSQAPVNISSNPFPSIPQLYHQTSSSSIPLNDPTRRLYTSPPGPQYTTGHAHPPPPPFHSQTSASSIPSYTLHTQANPATRMQNDRHQPMPIDHLMNASLESVAGPSSTSPNDQVSPSVALSEASVPPSTTIESILPRDLALHTIHLYFEHIWSIIPFIHRPSFMADLIAHEEEKRPIFFAIIMAMIATTLIHVPKSYFPIPAESVRKLSDRCLKACYAVTRREMDEPNVDLICIKYLLIVVHNKHGNVGLEASAFGEAQYLAISLGLHQEDTYYGLNPIEAERRRRVWFLIYNADKFEAISRSKPILLRSDEFMGPESTKFPTELDDKSITTHGYLPSSKPVPLICGFNTLTRLVSVLGDILVHERDIRRQQPSEPEDLLKALRQVRTLQHRVKQIADGLARPFQLDAGTGNTLPAPGWEEAVRDELDLFFSDPMSSETAKDGYLVMKANIHVTLAMTRLRLILHREDLLNRSGQPGTPSRNAAELVAADLGENLDWRQSVYQDLFKAVHGIPIQALAANGPSLVTKIRVVAVTLLDALPVQEQADAAVQGIAAYLLDFLNIMTSIESQFAD
ncbi:hypothetical protein CI109_102345 [Kwoniella shandongensis]|uniref:Uncharacterized protein n=1 Tax=Kwoniella shandongensis TaxID=1734106 RepID=A0A5M6BZW9_9TREE|nr:uncharacterized protein CI109_003336 [Kwoniella shandongensis]KAA5528436.1 hypothetical protein CI109_003336 [Kwoniella shandongensis]